MLSRNLQKKSHATLTQNEKIENKSLVQPYEEIDEATEILLHAKEEYLNSKPWTTLDEDLELELLHDPSTRLHATRIAELAFKEDKTELEKYELSLYESEETRPYAYRIIELMSKEVLVSHEKNELDWLRSPLNRPFTKVYVSILNKQFMENLTEKEKRILELFGDARTLKNSIKVAELEAQDKITEEEQADLSIAYLCKIADIPAKAIDDFHFNFRSIVFNPPNDCVVRDQRINTYSVEVAKFRAIQDAFNQSAHQLIEDYQRQILRKAPKLVKNSLFSQNSAVKTILDKRKNALSLAMEKIFFDYNLQFSQKNLDIVTNHLRTLIQNQKLTLNTDNYKSLQALLETQLTNIPTQAEEAKFTPSLR